MRFVTLLTILLTALVTQSCRVEMPSLIQLIGTYDARSVGEGPNRHAYHFNKSQALKVQTGFKDTLVIGDDPEVWHGEFMEEVIVRTGIPKKDLVFFKDFGFVSPFEHNIGLMMFVSDDWKWLREATKVVHIPLLVPLLEEEDPSLVANADVLFVLGAGNVSPPVDADRDLYNINHPVWSYPGDPKRDQRQKEAYQNVLKVYGTGKVIAATSAVVTRTGKIEPYEDVVPCGDIQESCFAVIPDQTTSPASARLAAMSFYLSQFYPTAEEIVEVLGACAMDIGEPGVDREYGRGLANLLCPQVLGKELAVVAEHLGETGESQEEKGGMLEGIWEARNSSLKVAMPPVLRETVQPQYQGEVNGRIEFKKNRIVADVVAEATVHVTFLLLIEAYATDEIRIEGRYEKEMNAINIQPNVGEPRTYAYTATKDSLHLVRSISLSEALKLLPGHLGALARQNQQEMLENDPLQIRMSFARVLLGDFDENDVVDFNDFLLFTETFGTRRGDVNFNESMDLVSDGIINFSDFLAFVEQFGKTAN